MLNVSPYDVLYVWPQWLVDDAHQLLRERSRFNSARAATKPAGSSGAKKVAVASTRRLE